MPVLFGCRKKINSSEFPRELGGGDVFENCSSKIGSPGFHWCGNLQRIRWRIVPLQFFGSRKGYIFPRKKPPETDSFQTAFLNGSSFMRSEQHAAVFPEFLNQFGKLCFIQIKILSQTMKTEKFRRSPIDQFPVKTDFITAKFFPALFAAFHWFSAPALPDRFCIRAPEQRRW